MLELIKHYEDKLKEIKKGEEFCARKLMELDKERQQYEHYLKVALENLGNN